MKTEILFTVSFFLSPLCLQQNMRKNPSEGKNHHRRVVVLQLKTPIIRIATMGTGDIKVVLRFVRSPINNRNGTDRRVSYSNRTTLRAIKLSTPRCPNTNGSSSMSNANTSPIWRSVTVAGAQNCRDAPDASIKVCFRCGPIRDEFNCRTGNFRDAVALRREDPAKYTKKHTSVTIIRSFPHCGQNHLLFFSHYRAALDE